MPGRIIDHRPVLRIARAAWLVGLAVVVLAESGCVQRRMTIRSNPPGAQVYIDDYDIGITPVSTSFLYYGTRKIRLVKDGYETLTVSEPISAPWYEYFPLDFVSENVWPGEIRDERVLDFQLSPQRMVPTELLLERAENLRSANQPTVVAPPGTGVILGPAPGTMAPGSLPPGFALPGPPPTGAYPSVPPPPPFSGTPRAPALQTAPGLPPGAGAPVYELPPGTAPPGYGPPPPTTMP
jgi:hypothetical protein